MEPSSFRPFSAEETRALARLSSGREERHNEASSALFAFCLTFGTSSLAVRCLAGPPEGAVLVALLGLAAAAALWVLVRMRRGPAHTLARERAAFAADLAGGRAECTTFEAVDALRVEEAEDEGSAYYLRLADGRVLFLSGQYLYDCEEFGAFPCARFTLVRAPASRLFLDLLVLGPPLAPSGTLPPFTSADHHADRVPRDGDVLDVDFESLRPKRAG